MINNRVLFFLLLFSFPTFIVVGQKVENMLYEVTIQSGTGAYGNTSIKFQLEGMLLRTAFRNEKNNNKYERKVEFIPMDKIDSRKMLLLFDYIYKNNLMTLNYEYIPNEYYPSSMKIRILDMNEEKFVQYKYNRFDPLFDELIEILNDLVPKQYKNVYQTKRIPNNGK